MHIRRSDPFVVSDPGALGARRRPLSSPQPRILWVLRGRRLPSRLGVLASSILWFLLAAGLSRAQPATHIEFDLSHTEDVSGVSVVTTDTQPGLVGGASLTETGQVIATHGQHDLTLDAQVTTTTAGRVRLSAEAEHVFDMTGTSLTDDVWRVGESRMLARASLDDVLTLSGVPGNSATLELYFQVRGQSEGTLAVGPPFSDLFFTMDTPVRLSASTSAPHSGTGLFETTADLPDGYTSSARDETVFIDEYVMFSLDIDPSVDVPLQIQFEIEADTDIRNAGEIGSLIATGLHRPSFWDNAAELLGVVVRDAQGAAYNGVIIDSDEGYDYPVTEEPPPPIPPTTVVLSPTAVIDSDLGEFNASLTPFEHMIDQSGLTLNFTSGQTSFDAHFSKMNAFRSSASFSGNWQSLVSFTFPLAGYVDFDLGADYFIDRLVVWGVTFEDVRIQISDDAVGPWTEVAQVTLPNRYSSSSFDGELIDLGGVHSARYLRLAIDSVYAIDPSFTYAIGGELVASATPVPEPTSVLGLAAGSAGLLGLMRRRKVSRNR